MDTDKCPECHHCLKFHTPSGCAGGFPNGTENIHPQEVFYGECLCTVRGTAIIDNKGKVIKPPTKESGA